MAEKVNIFEKLILELKIAQMFNQHVICIHAPKEELYNEMRKRMLVPDIEKMTHVAGYPFKDSDMLRVECE